MVKKIKLYNNFKIPKSHQKSILLIGNFDGFHLGHQKLFKLAKQYKKKNKIKFGVVTFNPIPKMFFNNNLKNKITELQSNLDRIKEENNDLYNKVADLAETLKSKDYFEEPDYQYLIDENRRLEQERNELLIDNKKLANQVEDKIDQLRKSGF